MKMNNNKNSYNLKSNKKANTIYIIAIIISSITLIIMISLLFPMIKDAQYQSSLTECNYLFKNINGHKSYFGNDMSKPNDLLLNSISNICPSKTIEIKTDSNMNQINNLVEDCWYKTGELSDIFAAHSNGYNICLLCGQIKPTKNINFKEYFLDKSNGINSKEYKKIFNSAESLNLNQVFLESTSPKILEEDETYYLIYYTESPQLENQDQIDSSVISQSITSIINDVDISFLSLADSLISSNQLKSKSGIFFQKETLSEKIIFKDEEKQSLSNRDLKFKYCDILIVPEEDFD